MRLSLLASARRLPCSSAARVAGQPGEADDRVEDDVDLGQRRQLGEHLGGIGTQAGRVERDAELLRLGVQQRRRCGPAASATTSYSSRWLRMTSSAWVPIEPVEPRTAIAGASGAASDEPQRDHQVVHRREAEQHGVEAVEHAPVTRQDACRSP